MKVTFSSAERPESGVGGDRRTGKRRRGQQHRCRRHQRSVDLAWVLQRQAADIAPPRRAAAVFRRGRIMMGTDPFVTRSAESRVSNSLDSATVLPVPAVPQPAERPPPAARPGPCTASRVVDDYAWMRRTDDPDLLAYLAAENAWCDDRDGAPGRPPAAPSPPSSPPRCRTRTSPPRGSRAAGSTGPAVRPAPSTPCTYADRPARTVPDDVLLDENALAEGHDFLELGVCEPSPDGTPARVLGRPRRAARSTCCGSATWRPAHDLPDELTGTYYGLGWSADGTSFLYTTLDDDVPAGHRCSGTSSARAQADDTVVWHEEDRRFELEVEPTRSGELVRLVARSRDTSEVRLVPTARPGQRPGAGRGPGARPRVLRRPPARPGRRPAGGR